MYVLKSAEFNRLVKNLYGSLNQCLFVEMRDEELIGALAEIIATDLLSVKNARLVIDYLLNYINNSTFFKMEFIVIESVDEMEQFRVYCDYYSMLTYLLYTIKSKYIIKANV